MTEKNGALKTGLFVLVGVGLFMGSVLIFGGSQSFLHSYDTYYLKFNSTQGLSRGSVVSLAGMEVGNVAEINFDSEVRIIAKVRIDRNYSALITDKTRATIRTQGALGDKYIYITPGDSAGVKIAKDGFIPSETAPDFIEMLTQGKGPDFSLVFSTLHELNILLNNLNADGRSAHLMENVVGASHSISTLMADPNIRESLVRLKSILSKVDRGDGSLGLLVNDSTLYNKLVSLLGDEPRNKYLKPLLREAIKQNEHNDHPH